MSTIVLHTDSLIQYIAKADIVVSIKETDDINKKIKELATLIQEQLISVAPGWMHVLHIVCKSNSTGLQLGTGVNHKNAEEIFLPLRCKVGSIVIHGCGAAAIYSKENNGALMCKRLARSVYANVTASDAVPTASTLNHIFNGCNKNLYLNRGGTVGEWNQSGKLIFVQEYNAEGSLIPDSTHLNYHTKDHFKKPVSSSISTPEKKNFLGKKLLRSLKLKKMTALYQHFSHFLHAAIIN